MTAGDLPSARPATGLALAFRNLIVFIARLVGTDVIDTQTGRKLGRALFVPWRGKVHVIGLEAEFPIRVHFLTQNRLTYWRQEIGFTAAAEPDYAHEPPPPESPRP